MKTKLIILSLFVFLTAYTQKKPNCQEVFLEFKLYYKVDFTEKAFLTPEGKAKTLEVITTTLKDCPSVDNEIYVLSQEMLTRIVQPMSLGEEKKNWTKHIVDLYDKQSQYFPEYKKENDLKKITLSYQNGLFDNKQAISALDAIFVADKGAFSADILNLYTSLVISEQMQTRKGVTKEYIKKLDVINGSILRKVSQLETEKLSLKAETPEFRKNKNQLDLLKISSKNIFADLKNSKLDCKAWNELYNEDYEKNKADVFWLENALNRLDTYKCAFNNSFFEAMATQYYGLKKTAKSAYYMGEIAFRKQDKEKAITYFSESAALEPNTLNRAKTYYKLADLNKESDREQAQAFAQQAIDNNSEMIESYILLSQLYIGADKTCFKNEFEAKAIYFLAAQNIEKVAQVNPKYTATTKRLSEAYLKKAPTAQEIKKAKMSGKSIDFGCWINKSVVIP